MSVEIADWNDLDNVRNDLTGDYVLVNNLDSETDGYAGIGDDFERLGVYASDGNSFTGTFDGDGHKILDLIISDDGDDARGHGLFGGIDGTVQNLSLDIEVDTTGFEASPDARPSALGLVFNDTTGTKIENVSVSGLVTTQDDDSRSGGLLAGIFGDVECEIINCTSSVTVTVPNGEPVGGLVGRNQGTIIESFATGSVDGGNQVGGLVGDNTTTITESYATGSVDSDDRVGGLVGRNQGTIIESFATGSVEGGSDVGGLVGGSSGTETDSYWDTETTGQSTTDGDGTGLTTAEMQGSEAETNMDGFDFANTWDSVVESDDDTTADGYPILLAVDREQQLNVQGILSLTAFTISALVNSESVEIQDIFAQVDEEVREVTEAFALINGSVEQI